jgi:hypothetical protein
MRLRNFVLTATVACAVGWFGGTVWSEDPAADAEMEKWLKFGEPAEEHARLKAFVGEWNVVGSGMGGDFKGTSSTTLLFGGRYLAHEAKGEIGGKPFEGRGLMGYDKGTKRFNAVWIDNYSTNIMYSDGTEKEKGKVWEFKGSVVGPDGEMKMRDVYTVVSDKEYKIESHVDMGGSEMLGMTMKFTRK